MTIEIIATTAVALLAPYLVEFGNGAAGKLGEDAGEAGGRLLGWMRAKLGGRAREALGDLEAAPASADNEADLRKQLVKALEAEPGLAEELRALLPAGTIDASAMNQMVSGDGAKGAQVKGSGNNIFVGS